MKRLGTTRPFRTPAGGILPGSIAEIAYVRLGGRNVAIYGHSWGSALGVLYAARFPEKVAAYVGAGQMGSWPASEASSYAFVLAEAERRKNRRALRELRAI